MANDKRIILSQEEKTSIQNVRDFIKSNWGNTIRSNPKDSSTFIGLPLPYTVPCISGSFQEMYYWDTYFTNVGLIIDGNVEQAKNNCENMLYLVDRLGFMPNGNRTWFLDRSQPPYLSMMIRDVFEKTKDLDWLKHCLPALEKEYTFWMTKRITPIGLNHFSNSTSEKDKIESCLTAGKRLGSSYDTTVFKTEAERIRQGSHFYAECESGWDYNPRFDSRCEDFCPIDLNCNLYLYEKNFAYFYSQLNRADSVRWNISAENRKQLINNYLFNEKEQLFYDYDFVNQKHSTIYSAAVFSLLWSKIATQDQAKSIVESLSKLEFNYGISACAPGDRKFSYQWDYPNGWACLQYLTVKGLQNYGYEEAANRIAYKNVITVVRNFKQTNNLWEKYNITDCSINVKNEYEMPAMMGWTAGTFVYLSDYLLNE
jgi:alpha,alpha-trehalase